MKQFILGLAILPTIVIGTFIYKNDRIEKEPTKLLIKLVVSGAFATVLTLLLTELLYLFLPFFADSNYEALDAYSLAVYVFVGVALIEELSKWLFTYFVAWNDRAFDYVYDAIVYSTFVSLGFATVENLLYILGASSVAMAIGTAVTRMLFSVPGHVFFGVTMGYYLGLAKLTKTNGIRDKSLLYLFLSLFVPIVFHFVFDYLLMLDFAYNYIVFLIFVFAFFSVSLYRVKRLSIISTKLLKDD